MHYAAIVTEALAGWQPAGRSALMSPLTIPHRPGDAAADLWNALSDAWRWLVKHNDWRGFRARWAIAEWCATTEANYSDETGFHPHDHGIVFRDGPELTVEELDAFEAQLTQLWATALLAAGWARKLNLHHGVSVVPVDQVGEVGRYLFKHAGLEFAAPGGTKVGRSSTSIPLRDVPVWLAELAGPRTARQVIAGDRQAYHRAEAWLEYRAAASGRRAFRCSRGFYRLTGTKAMGVAEIRRKTIKLRVEDRQRVEAALTAAGFPPLDDGVDDSPVEGDEARPPVLAMSWEAFSEAQAAIEAPAQRGSGAVVLEVVRAGRDRPAFHALVCHLLELYGPARTARVLASSMGRPPDLWVDGRGTVIVGYYQDGADWEPLPVGDSPTAQMVRSPTDL